MNKLEQYKNDFKNYKIPKTMEAVVLSGAGFENIAVKKIPVPEPGPKQLLARVDAEQNINICMDGTWRSGH